MGGVGEAGGDMPKKAAGGSCVQFILRERRLK